MNLRIPFFLRGLKGHITVDCEPNHDPESWGYAYLELNYPIDVAKGFPVCLARVVYPGEGYRAVMGWIQIVSYQHEQDKNVTVLVDTPPQLSDTGAPYFSWGIRPVLFDAPSFADDTRQKPRTGISWMANAYLVATPDVVMTKVVHALCGFSWGYTTRKGHPELEPLVKLDHDAWEYSRNVLQEKFPDWEFSLQTA